jgi:hypothetical protein
MSSSFGRIREARSGVKLGRREWGWDGEAAWLLERLRGHVLGLLQRFEELN